MASVVNFLMLFIYVITTVHNTFAKKKIGEMISPSRNTFLISACKQLRAHFKCCQIKPMLKHYLNICFLSFNNGFKQLCTSIFELQYILSYDLASGSELTPCNKISGDMRFPTMWYVRPAKPQISLHIRAVLSEPLLAA